LEIVTRKFSWQATLFVSNWYSPFTNSGIAYWFVEAYLQILLLLALCMWFKPARTWLVSGRIGVDVTLLVVGALMERVGQRLWNTEHLFNRLPHILFVLFVLGWACARPRNVLHRLALSVATLLICWPNPLLIVPVLFLLWVPVLLVPNFAVGPISAIASASLFIYLTHFQFGSVGTKIYGRVPVLSLVLAVLGGILIWKAYSGLLHLTSSLAGRLKQRGGHTISTVS
jgi:hypothetical protein